MEMVGVGIWGRRLEEVAPDQILSPLRGFSVATLLPRAAFVCSGTVPRTDFSGADSGSEHTPPPPHHPAPQGVLPLCHGWEVCCQRHRKGDPAKWLDASKGKGERLHHGKNLVVGARMEATHARPRTPGSSLVLGLVQSRSHPCLIRATLQTFLRNSADPAGPPGS